METPAGRRDGMGFLYGIFGEVALQGGMQGQGT